MKLKGFRHHLVAFGLGFWLLGIADYSLAGFNWLGWWLWLTGIVALGLGLRLRHRHTAKLFDRWDWLILALILLAFAPFYLRQLYQLPVQMSTDEIVVMNLSRNLTTMKGVDWFGPSYHYAFPNLIFIIFGKIGLALGGITMAHMRFVHAMCGLAIIGFGYGMFRQLASRWWAAVATIILGANHSLVMISRLAMRDNTGLLFEVIALTALLAGLRLRNWWWLYVGGVIAGLSWYSYYPGRVSIVVWLMFIGTLFVLQHHWPRRVILQLAVVAVLGWVMAVLPLTIANRKNPDTSDYSKAELLIYPEGRQHQKEWVNATSIRQGIEINIKNGLGVFNNKVWDLGFIYSNPGHGFVDTLTGWLLWLGLAVWALQLFIKRPPTGEWLMIVGFFSIWLLLAFVINKAPDYTRLLVVLPFVAYWAMNALRWAGEVVRRLKLGWVSPVLAVIALSIIIIGNYHIAEDFIIAGQNDGNPVGSTGRYVTARADEKNYQFFLAADDLHPYYGWNTPEAWRSWIIFFAGPNQSVQVLPPAQLARLAPTGPFTIFMNQQVWATHQVELHSRYPGLSYHLVTTVPALVAVESR